MSVIELSWTAKNHMKLYISTSTRCLQKEFTKTDTIILLNSNKVNLRGVQAGAVERTRGWWWWWWTPATFLSSACPGDDDDNNDGDDDDDDDGGHNLDDKYLLCRSRRRNTVRRRRRQRVRTWAFYQQPTLCKHSALHKSGVWSKVHVICLHWKQYICEWDEQVWN